MSSGVIIAFCFVYAALALPAGVLIGRFLRKRRRETSSAWPHTFTALERLMQEEATSCGGKRSIPERTR